MVDDQDAERQTWPAMKLGMAGKCPSCGEGKLFKKFTTINDECPSCGLNINGHRADDAPPYVTIMIVGHVAIPIALMLERVYAPPMTFQLVFWSIVMVAMSLWLLPVAKGALINLQWANRMHGFSPYVNDSDGYDACGPEPKSTS